jgi:hypothetical protein
MEITLKDLKETIHETHKRLKNISSEDWSSRNAPTKWSKKEILGHLIDSAANNHQRLVRVQFEDNPAIRYDQDKWVMTQDYHNASINDLIELWLNYNKHLTHIISKMPKEKYERTCDVGKEESVTLEWLVKDYLRHLKHHLNQIMGELL